MNHAVARLYKDFDSLCTTVSTCDKCPRMKGSARVLSRAAGLLKARVMFIGEAPGRLGADASEIPFHGDKAGHNFEELLICAGLGRGDIFVTNAVLCNPRDSKGNNASPNDSEIANCTSYLRRQIDLVNPAVVVTLGAAALRALGLIEEHRLTLRDARTAVPWYGRVLVPLYHPGQRAMIHRPYAQQKQDYQFVASALVRKGIPLTRRESRIGTLEVAREIATMRQAVSLFALHKLFYLFELDQVRAYGHQLTNGFFIRQKDGPYCVDFHPAKLKRANLVVRTRANQKPVVMLDTTPDLFKSDVQPNSLSVVWKTDLERVLLKYKGLSDTELKTKAYLSNPMRRILRDERLARLKLLNVPIDLESTHV